MVASDGDLAKMVRSTRGVPQLGGHRVEVHAADVDVDANGDGSTAVDYDDAFANGTVFPLATMQGSDTGDVSVRSAGQSQAVVEVSGSGTTGEAVTVTLLVIGPEAGQT